MAHAFLPRITDKFYYIRQKYGLPLHYVYVLYTLMLEDHSDFFL